MRIPIIRFSPVSCQLLHLRFQYLPSLFLKHIQPVFFPQCDRPNTKLSVLPTMWLAQSQTECSSQSVTGPVPDWVFFPQCDQPSPKTSQNCSQNYCNDQIYYMEFKKKVFCSYGYHSTATACRPQHLLTTYTNSQFLTHNAMASVGNYKSSSHKTRPLLGRWWEIRSPSSIFIDLLTQNMWTQRSFKALRIKDPRMRHHITEDLKLLATESPSNLKWIS